MMKISEKDIQTSILNKLKKLGIYAWRNNTGVTKIGDRIISFGHKGSSDIFCFHNGRFVAIEVKSAGGKVTDHQEAFLDEVNKNAHCLGIVAYSKEDVIKALNL